MLFQPSRVWRSGTFFGGFLALISLVGCGKQSAEAPVFLFSGECTVEVISKTEGADIRIDGISVGEVERSKVQIPCGEKQIAVVKEGFLPYHEYLPTTIEEPLKVTVELTRVPPQKNFALSDELVRQVAKGMKPVDPSSPDAQIRLAKAEQDAENSMKAQIAQAAAKSSGGTVQGTGAAGAPAALGPGPWDTVDYWR